MKKKGLILLIVTGLLLSVTGCTTTQSYQGGSAGALLGAAAGALIDKNNRWRGAVLGGTIGSAMGAITTEIAARAAREAAFSRQPVAYESNDGWQRVEARPMGYDARTRCHKVHEKIWQGGKLVKDYIREVCEGNKTENRY